MIPTRPPIRTDGGDEWNDPPGVNDDGGTETDAAEDAPESLTFAVTAGAAVTMLLAFLWYEASWLAVATLACLVVLSGISTWRVAR